jgi:hypothetical protein
MRHLANRPARVRDRGHVVRMLLRGQLGIDRRALAIRDDAVGNSTARAPDQSRAGYRFSSISTKTAGAPATTSCAVPAVPR